MEGEEKWLRRILHSPNDISTHLPFWDNCISTCVRTLLVAPAMSDTTLKASTMADHLKNKQSDHGTFFHPKKEDLDTSFDENDITLLDVRSSNSNETERLSKKDIQKIIAEAHHDLLYSSGNNAYVTIWEELHRMK